MGGGPITTSSPLGAASARPITPEVFVARRAAVRRAAARHTTAPAVAIVALATAALALVVLVVSVGSESLIPQESGVTAVVAVVVWAGAVGAAIAVGYRRRRVLTDAHALECGAARVARLPDDPAEATAALADWLAADDDTPATRIGLVTDLPALVATNRWAATTVAELVARGRRVLIVDLGERADTTVPGLADVARGKRRLADVVVRSPDGRLAAIGPGDDRVVAADALHLYADRLEADYDLLLVVLPATAPDVAAALAAVLDRTVLLTATGVHAHPQLRRRLAALGSPEVVVVEGPPGRTRIARRPAQGRPPADVRHVRSPGGALRCGAHRAISFPDTDRGPARLADWLFADDAPDVRGRIVVATTSPTIRGDVWAGGVIDRIAESGSALRAIDVDPGGPVRQAVVHEGGFVAALAIPSAAELLEAAESADRVVLLTALGETTIDELRGWIDPLPEDVEILVVLVDAEAEVAEPEPPPAPDPEPAEAVEPEEQSEPVPDPMLADHELPSGALEVPEPAVASVAEELVVVEEPNEQRPYEPAAWGAADRRLVEVSPPDGAGEVDRDVGLDLAAELRHRPAPVPPEPVGEEPPADPQEPDPMTAWVAWLGSLDTIPDPVALAAATDEPARPQEEPEEGPAEEPELEVPVAEPEEPSYEPAAWGAADRRLVEVARESTNGEIRGRGFDAATEIAQRPAVPPPEPIEEEPAGELEPPQPDPMTAWIAALASLVVLPDTVALLDEPAQEAAVEPLETPVEPEDPAPELDSSEPPSRPVPLPQWLDEDAGVTIGRIVARHADPEPAPTPDEDAPAAPAAAVEIAREGPVPAGGFGRPRRPAPPAPTPQERSRRLRETFGQGGVDPSAQSGRVDPSTVRSTGDEPGARWWEDEDDDDPEELVEQVGRGDRR